MLVQDTVQASRLILVPVHPVLDVLWSVAGEVICEYALATRYCQTMKEDPDHETASKCHDHLLACPCIGPTPAFW